MIWAQACNLIHHPKKFPQLVLTDIYQSIHKCAVEITCQRLNYIAIQNLENHETDQEKEMNPTTKK